MEFVCCWIKGNHSSAGTEVKQHGAWLESDG
jgi:hypothetical protein